MGEPLVALRDVWKVYALGDLEVEALRGVDLDIAAGEFVAVMGASGSGKSTLMNLVGCLDRPTRGRVLMAGIDTGTLPADGRAELRNRRIGFVFQNFNLLPRTSAVENVELPMVYGDTPIGNLDSQTTGEIMRIVARLHREQRLTVILVTHEPDVAAWAERVITFRDGVIVGDVRQELTRSNGATERAVSQ